MKIKNEIIICLVENMINLHFRSNPLMNLKIFETVHSLMNYTNLIDSCQAHLPAQCVSISNLFARSDAGVVIDSEPHPSRTCKTSFLFVHWLSMFTLAVPLFRLSLQQNR